MSLPSVTLKLATSLDGRIATGSGESQWITGEAARAQVQRLRAAHDAVGVGAGTALADDPLLTARTDPPPSTQPWRVVFDRALRVSPAAQLFHSRGAGPVALVTLGEADAFAGLGVTVVRCGRADSATAMLEALAAATGIGSILVEGGGVFAAALVAEGRIDRLEWFRAPIVLGAEGRPAIGPLGLQRLSEARRFRRVSVTDLGEDLQETYVRVEHKEA
jgi:diaminohydroxyphosphoribosylaminopyrimidine deaminase / 5-amino-6-(5-phosphoribosylamino)uracil reductase